MEEYSVALKVSQTKMTSTDSYFVPAGARGIVQDIVIAPGVDYGELKSEPHIRVLFLEPFCLCNGKRVERPVELIVHPSNLEDWVELGG